MLDRRRYPEPQEGNARGLVRGGGYADGRVAEREIETAAPGLGADVDGKTRDAAHREVGIVHREAPALVHAESTLARDLFGFAGDRDGAVLKGHVGQPRRTRIAMDGDGQEPEVLRILDGTTAEDRGGLAGTPIEHADHL